MSDDAPPRLTVATCQFSVFERAGRNREQIEVALAKAADAGADMAHFPEGALSGYAGKGFAGWNGFDWDALAVATADVQAACATHGIWAVVGSCRANPGGKPFNSVLAIDDSGAVAGAYDKRRLSIRDREHYAPGTAPLVLDIRGVRCGFLICLDWSFPNLFRAYADAGCDVVFLSAYSAGHDGDVLHTEVIPPLMQGHAFTNGLFLSVSNAANRIQAFPSHWVRRSGRKGPSCRRGATGMIVNAIADEPDKDAFYAMVRRFRADSEKQDEAQT